MHEGRVLALEAAYGHCTGSDLITAIRRVMPVFDVGTILAGLRRERWCARTRRPCRLLGDFQNAEVVTHVIRNRRGASVVGEVTDGDRPAISVSDLYGAR